ncbi:1-aminocyclopropane-1-carboxylate deaminase/D-cysteine desulfhydrase [Nocardioides yefusunii]|uniref:1-aminocyclopropane-1-carboxylate deaminase/D-cysteine desulfhydrase n=1 Tax=Nocardioides yefusunii TaxID=2500546 RepID=A0ABW1R1V9_9ACTN|nr:pyridoxal-phosphate dependent enzyme [Nocardioides yefusunii]
MSETTSLIQQAWPDVDLDRVVLGAAPTPVQRLVLDGVDAGVELWVKREDAYGDGAWGGNKVRKLEWILAEAKRRGVTSLLTLGGIGTHWGLACARYGAEHGLRTTLALVDQPIDDHVRQQWALLQSSGAVINRFVDMETARQSIKSIEEEMSSEQGEHVWSLPMGGSNEYGTLGYVEAALEIAAQVEAGEMSAPGTVVVPVGSGGTVAGVLLGLAAAGLRTHVLGVVVNDGLDLSAEAVAALANRTADLLRERGAVDVPVISPDDVEARIDWLGATYGDPTPASVAMVEAAARAGLEIEPVYTGKALAAVAALGTALTGPVLWMNTHGPR